MKSVVVLGAGMIGSTMAWDMRARGYDVTVVDAREDALARVRARADVRVVQADLSDPARIGETVAPFDLVLGALSSSMGFATLRAVLVAQKNYVDISFMGQNAWDLDALAKENGVCAIVDCGVAPGSSNVIIGDAVGKLDPCERIEIFVGGLPVVRRWPFEYQAPFAPSDVIEEYVRPARIVENGKIELREALSEPELIDFAGVGTLEAFNTDGLRSLAYTMNVPEMREKTMRYPGHIALMRAFRETGLFSEEAIDVGGVRVAPRDVLAKLLYPKWSFAEGEEDITVLRIAVTGRSDGHRVRRTWDLVDRYDPKEKLRSMSRTTAFPATTAAHLLATGAFSTPGVHPPEALGRVGLAPAFLADLEARGIRFSFREEALLP